MSDVRLTVMLVCLSLFTTGIVVADDTSQRETFAEVVVDDLVIGEDELQIGPMRAVGFGEDAEEVVVKIDVTVLENHGVGLDNATVDLVDEDVRRASVVSTSTEEGVITIVFEPNDSVLEVDSFSLDGLSTEGAEAASGLSFKVTIPEGEGRAHSFDIINPDEETPTVSPETLHTGVGEQQITVERIQTTGGNVTIKLDTTVLETHGIAVYNLDAEVVTEKATVRETTVEDGIVTVLLAPDDGTVLFDARIQLSGFGATAVDTDEQVIASDVTYDVRIEGDANDRVGVETFNLVNGYPSTATELETGSPEPTVQSEDVTSSGRESTRQTGGTTRISEDGPGFGIAIALIAVLGSGLFITRRM